MNFALNRRFAPLLAAPAAVMVIFGSGFKPAPSDPDPDPSFYADIFPILQQNCQACHQPAGRNLGGMVAPMSLLTYEETRPWAPVIAAVVKAGRMPPWHAPHEFKGKFEDERYLEPEEIETLVAWAAAGAPEGTRPAGWTPPAPTYATADGDSWSIGEPDLIIGFAEPYLVGDDVYDSYVNINVEITAEQLPEDRWIQAVEFHPGGPHVHHIIASPLGGTAPGMQPKLFREGYGQLLRAGTNVTFQMHYHKEPGPGTAVEDLSKAAIRFYEPGEVIRHVVRNDALGIFDFVIPPGAADYSRTYERVFEEDSYILSLNPHMHLRGKAAKYEVFFPDGRSEVILHVPNYDFSWQHIYTFREPVLVPAGTKLVQTLWWDNSADNPHNPDPTVAVRWGQPTTDEMGFGFMQWTAAEPRNIVVGEEIPADVLRFRDSLLEGLTPRRR
jgi:mono/diheme cytochrome c family protein